MFLILVPIDHMPAEMNLIFDLSTDTVEPLYNKVLGVTNDFVLPRIVKFIERTECNETSSVITNRFYQSLFPSLFRGSTVITENIRSV